MSRISYNKQLNQDANTTITTLLEQDRKTKRLLVRRKAADLQKSHDSRRSFNTPKISDFEADFKPAYIKQTAVLVNHQYKSHRTISKQQQFVTKIHHNCPKPPSRNLVIEVNNEKLKEQPKTEKSNVPKLNSMSSIFKHASQLQQQIQKKTKVIQENLILKQDLINLENLNCSLQKSNEQLMQQMMRLRNELSTSNIQRRKLESEKKSLIKKVNFLEKMNFDSETKHLQSFRQEFLEKQIENLKNIINANKSHLELILHDEFIKMKHELYESRKTISLQQIKLLCQQTKLNQYKINQNMAQQNCKLKVRQKKLVQQMRELRKEVDKLQKLNKELVRENNEISFTLD